MTNRYLRSTDGRAEVAQVTDRDAEGPTSEVVRAVATRSNRNPVELPPLNEVIDPDALDRLFAPTPTGTPRPGGRLVFPYAGYRVQVTGTDDVSVEPLAHEG